MQEYVFRANIVFNSEGVRFFNFPIRNSVRMSLWLNDEQLTTPSQIELSNEKIYIDREYSVRITVPKVVFLEKKIFIGRMFKLGLYPTSIASGVIIELLEI